MKIIHNIALSVTEQERTDFFAAGIELRIGFGSFRIEENDPRWSRISLLVERFHAVDTVTTEFSPSELNGAEFLGMAPSWHHGYPEPAIDRGYLSETFSLENFCRECGVGKRQVAPFRMKRAPTWGRKSIFQLNWIFDEYFVKPEVWAAIFEPLGVTRSPVLLHRTGQEIDSVVQLKIHQDVDLKLDGASFEKCTCCGSNKYLPIGRGFYPKPLRPRGELLRSTQYFGSGASAHRLVLVSQALYRKINEAGLQGVIFKPCAL